VKRIDQKEFFTTIYDNIEQKSNFCKKRNYRQKNLNNFGQKLKFRKKANYRQKI